MFASAAPTLGDRSVLDEAAPPAEPDRTMQLDARDAVPGGLASAAGESSAQSNQAATAPKGDGDGVSPLTVVLLTLIISAGAFGLLMVTGAGATIERR